MLNCGVPHFIHCLLFRSYSSTPSPMKRTFSTFSEATSDPPTPPHPLSQFDWPEMIEDMQDHVVSFLDNGTKEAFSHTHKKAWGKWHLDPKKGRVTAKIWTDLLAQNAPLNYIDAFIWGPPVQPVHVSKMVAYLIKWNRWFEPGIAVYFLTTPNKGKWTPQAMNKYVMVAAIGYSKLELFKQRLSLAPMGEDTFPGGVYDKEFLVGSVAKYGAVELVDEVLNYLNVNYTIEPILISQMISLNTVTKPQYSFQWSKLAEKKVVKRWLDGISDLLVMDALIARAITNLVDRMKRQNIDGYYFFQKLESFLALWKVHTAKGKFHHPFKCSIMWFYNGHPMRLPSEKVEYYLNLAEEMGMSIPESGVYGGLGFASLMSILLKVEYNETLEKCCQWLIRRGAFDLPRIGVSFDDLWYSFYSYFQNHPHLSTHQLESIQTWLARQHFKGASLLLNCLHASNRVRR